MFENEKEREEMKEKEIKYYKLAEKLTKDIIVLTAGKEYNDLKDETVMIILENILHDLKALEKRFR